MSGTVKKWTFALLFLLIFLILLAGFIPLLVQEFVLPPVLARAGLSGYELSVSRLGLHGCSLHIAGRPPFSPVVSGNLRIDWTPSGLLGRRIERISSRGLQINLVDLPAGNDTLPAQPHRQKNTGEGPSLPFLVRQIEVTDGSLYLPIGKRIAYLPFTFSGKLSGAPDLTDPAGAINFQAGMVAAEQPFNLTLSMDPTHGTLSVELDANLDLKSAAAAYPLPESKIRDLDGFARINIAAATRLAPFSVESFEAVLLFDDLSAAGNGFSIESPDDRPATITAAGTGSRFQVTGSDLQMKAPLRTSLEFDADITSGENRLHWQGAVELEPEAGTSRQARFTFNDDQSVRISHAGSGSAEGISVQLSTAQLEIRTTEQPGLPQNDIEAAVEMLNADIRIKYGQQSDANTITGTVSFHARNTNVASAQGSVTIPDLTMQTDGSFFPGRKGHYFAARLRAEDTSFYLEKQDIRAQGVQLQLPLSWPQGDNRETGFLRIGTIRKSGRNAGNLTAEIVQKGAELLMEGALHTLLFPQENIALTGSIRPPEKNNVFADFAFDLAGGHFAAANFAPFFPALQGMEGAGKVDAHGDLSISPCGLTGKADLALNSGSLALKDADTEVDDLNFRLRFPALPSLTTSPVQEFSIGEIRKKKLVVNNVQALFEIEPSGTLFIEKISGHWSGGRLFTGSFRLRQDQEEFDLAVFCDRLELSAILSQLNLAEAGGEGRLSGRIPLAYSGGSFFVDDGFLFSTPGEKGYLKIKQSKYLETTIPADVPQFSPLHFAGAALADFEYNWAKLQIMSVEENLLVKLQVDGRPREKLPYRFDAGKNVFVRLEDESKGGIDQPIKLDVNFNIPVNELLPYTNKLIPLFRKLN